MRWFIFVVFITFASCKLYKRCELARELKAKHNVQGDQLATWVCIARHESLYNTSAVNPGSGDHGIFQISELFWCSIDNKDKACHLPCEKFRDDDITDDFQCAKKIYKEHQRLQGDGYKAWVVYDSHCSNDRSKKYLRRCNFNKTNPSLRNLVTFDIKSYE